MSHLKSLKRHSLFFRLLLIYLGTFIAIAFAVSATFKAFEFKPPRENIKPHVQKYALYLAREIGIPPSLERMKKISRDLGIEVIVFGPEKYKNSTNASLNTLNPKNNIAKRPFWKSKGETHHHGIQAHLEGYQFVFLTQFNFDSVSLALAISISLVLIFLILFMSYRWVRHIFSPIETLNRAFSSFRPEEPPKEIKTNARHELAQLQQSFHSMANRVHRSFHSMRELLIAVSHDIRSPLTRMKVASDQIDNPKLKDCFRSEVDLLDQLTENLLELERVRSNPDAIQIREIDLGTLLSQLTAPYLAIEKPRIEIHLPEVPLLAKVDPERIQIAVRNLIENALNHSNHKNPIQVKLSSSNSKILIEIADDGDGVPQEMIDRISEPFFRGDSSRGHKSRSFGLGLALTQAIAKAHGGRVKIESSPNQGTRIGIELPSS